ncbi:lipoate-protein ligase B [Rubidibacter lacunae KORDI 51-2]|uniref:Octanoyltransferase n=1 Tax=Rubidibacter lacunae KORDI 51-2 TaxID=582515 RepID=U5DME1_9CHRO|nr:lipoyl(octanoyl) transferase LipB [Rubidibacter lacunae]ERN41764.1 lipoate-protein ligase B [Rubidibacter lacunae KORDI 51-2]
MTAPRCCWLVNLGCVPYRAAWQLQRDLVVQRLVNASLPDVLLLMEHPPVYTLGTGSSKDFVRFDPDRVDVELIRTERGGEVTYHCPGQLVGYPILNLQYYRRDLHWYLRQLEAVAIDVLDNYGLRGERVPGRTGTWVDGRKLVAIGIKVRRWIAMHGFALNVCPDLSGFARIVPCGIGDRPVGSVAQFVPEASVESARPLVAAAFAGVFGVQFVSVAAQQLSVPHP